MKNTKQFFIALAIVFSGVIYAQEEIKESKSESKFTLALGVNTTAIRQGTDLSEAVSPSLWNSVTSVSSISVGYNIAYGLSVNADINISKTIEDEGSKVLMNTDLKANYDLGQFINVEWFAPYISTGVGYVQLGNDSGGSFIFGGGINFWISDVVGINLNSDYNHPMSKSSDTKGFYQHGLGLIFKL